MSKRSERRQRNRRKRHKTDKGCNGPCCKNPRRNGWTKGKGRTYPEELADKQAKLLVE